MGNTTTWTKVPALQVQSQEYDPSDATCAHCGPSRSAVWKLSPFIFFFLSSSSSLQIGVTLVNACVSTTIKCARSVNAVTNNGSIPITATVAKRRKGRATGVGREGEARFENTITSCTPYSNSFLTSFCPWCLALHPTPKHILRFFKNAHGGSNL